MMEWKVFMILMINYVNFLLISFALPCSPHPTLTAMPGLPGLGQPPVPCDWCQVPLAILEQTTNIKVHICVFLFATSL